MKRSFSILMIVTLLMTAYSGLFTNITQAAPTGTRLYPTYATHSDDSAIRKNDGSYAQIGNYTVSSQSTKNVTIDIPTNPGKKIKSLKWYDANGSLIRNASGAWVGKLSYTGTDTLSGVKLSVKALGGSPSGGVYSWDRSGGSNTWTASAPEQGVKYANSSTCPSAPTDTWGYKVYPNCTDDRLPARLIKREPYLIQGISIGEIYEGRIEDKSIVLSSLKPVDVQPDVFRIVDNENHGTSGTPDPTTKFLGVYDSASVKNQITIRFQQTFGENSLNKGYYKDWANPGARQMWYFYAFTFAFQADTYLYKDKQLYVEWEDAGGVVDPCITNPTAPGCGAPTPTPTYNITGDFDVIPSEIEFRESFAIKPKNIVISSGCTYVNHRYTIRRDGDYSLSNYVTSRTQTTSYTYSTYLNIIGVGYHEVTMRIIATCDGKTIETNPIGPKPLTVNGPSNNSPPIFSAGFFKENDYVSFKPPSEVVVNSRVNLRIINDITQDPAWPYDPDGDPITYTWDFASSSSEWIRSLKTEYGLWDQDERHTFLTANVLGQHCIRVTARDPYGASSTRNVCLNVIPPNPIPIINGPNEVVEGRLLPKPFDGSQSYSPMGRTISQYIWGNKHEKYMVPGTEQITLDVVDSAGLRSLGTASHILTVKEDLPPLAQLQYVDRGLRNLVMNFKDTSYSPDHDVIVTHTDKLVCDKNNNGSFKDDVATNMTRDASGSFTFTPTTVGNCAIIIYLQEDWGKNTEKSFPFTVLNEAPEANFTALGVNPEPPVMTSVAPTMSMLMSSSMWKASSIPEESIRKGYRLNAATNSLETKAISHIQPYRSVSTNNVAISTQLIKRSYCGSCGNTGSISGAWYNFSPDSRLDRRLWGPLYYATYYDEDRVVKANRNPPMAILGGSRNYAPVVNVETGIIWDRKQTSYTSAYTHTWEDMLYRISDLKSYSPGSSQNSYNDDNTIINPYSTTTASSRRPDGQWAHISEVAAPPIPTGFTMPVPVVDGVDMEVTNIEASNGILKTSTTLRTNYNKDFNNNVFKNSCVTGYAYNKCDLEKYNTTGTKLWSFSISSTSSNLWIDYVASDNSKLIVRDNINSIYILDNTTGSLAFQEMFNSGYSLGNNTGGISFTNSALLNREYYLGVYDDKVAYISQTVDPEISTKVGKNGYWELKFYNLTTGKITSRGNIKTYIGTIKLDDQDNYTRNNPVAKAVISSDGKLVLANYYSKILIYDMKTLIKEGEIVTGLNDQTIYKSKTRDSDYWSDYSSGSTIKSIHLTEDGRLKVVYRYEASSRSEGSSNDDAQETLLTIQTGLSTSSSHSYSYGYLTNGDSMQNGDLTMKVKFNKHTYSDASSVGFGFRSQDHRNMYRAEMSGGQVKLVKIVDGVATTLGSSPYTVSVHRFYDLKVKVRGTHLMFYVNGVPMIDVDDDTYEMGQFGPFAEVPYVTLKDYSYATQVQTGKEIENQAIVNMPITYTKTYKDVENDPLIPSKTSWMFTNMKPYKFLDVGDGTSDPLGTNSYNGLILKEPSPALSKVGIFKVDLLETDDPAPAAYKHPNTVFVSFQKTSDPATNLILVHRRPISRYTVSVATNNTVNWNDTSYDPDRWLSPSKYSTEATGINYQSTRGITERRYYYIDPEGNTIQQKLVTPSEIGTYTVALAVKDEYGAWSDWTEQTIEIAAIVAPNLPPIAGFTVSPSTGYRTTPFTITSTARDPEDGVAANIAHEYYIRNLSEGGPESLQSTSRGGWAKAFSSLGMMEIRQVVTDSKGVSAQMIKTVTVLNRPPVANFDWLPKPAWEGDIVTITNQSSDADGDPLTYSWSITGPSMGQQTAVTTHISRTFLLPADYVVTLTVSDGKAESSLTRTIRIHPLLLTADVSHTELWLEHHLQKGHETVLHPKSFYTGEIFVVSAVGSLAATSRVTASLDAIGRGGIPIAISVELVSGVQANHFRAQLYDSILSSLTDGLPEGQHQIDFKIEYMNGVVKEVSIPIQIIGHVLGAVNVHRRQ